MWKKQPANFWHEMQL